MRRLTHYTLAVLAMAAAAQTSAQDGATAHTQNYPTLLDNEQMQVVRVHYDPHEDLPVHDHSRYPTVYVYLSNSGPVTRRPVRAGWFRVSPGRLEKHQVANLGPMASDFLRVECKQIALGQIRSEFRYSEDVNLTKTSATTDYSSPEMVIRRFVVAPGGIERIQVETRPELLIAFAPTLVRERGEADRTMAAGSVLWAKAGENLEVMAASSVAAHVLAIRLLK
jgi:quercetin dioxygenase-like cupin family protein